MTLALIGLGLIAGNIAIDTRKYLPNTKIFALDINAEALLWAESNNIIDKKFTALPNLCEALSAEDLLIICTPPAQVLAIIKTIESLATANFTISDVTSTKLELSKNIDKSSAKIKKSFVPAHPIAGSEKKGVNNSIADCFNNKRVVLCPLASNERRHIAKVVEFWQTLNANIDILAADNHDAIFALTSHLPHILAFSMLNILLDNSEKYRQLLKYPSAGFQDFTRIGFSNPEMWSQICTSNQQQIATAIDDFVAILTNIKQDLLQGKIAQLENRFNKVQRLKIKTKN